MKRSVLFVASLALLGAWTTLPSASAKEKVAEPRQLALRGQLAVDELSTIDIFRKASPSVAYITTLDQVVNLLTMNVQEVPSGTGSGFLWDEQGHVVTNFHVIKAARKAKVRFSDQQSYDATLVGVSPANDLAVLKVDFKGQKPASIPLGSSHDLQVGQHVLAIGNPFGLDHTLTSGIVSALDRSLTGDSGSAIHHLVQTDAAINPGNSGGPLLDSAGRLIGVNTAIYSPSGASAGIGFAIPVDTVNRVVPEIIAYGEYRRPSMGISTNDQANEYLARSLGIRGVAILDISKGSPAAKVGLQIVRLGRDGKISSGDVIQSIDGKPIANIAEMDRQLDTRKIGDKVRLGVLRDGKQRELHVELVNLNRTP